MARHSIIATPRGPSTLYNMRREGSGGYPLMLMETGETRKVALDMGAFLESGETISSATVAAEGVTAAISTSGATCTVTLSAPTAWGEADITVTLSSGEVIKETIRARLSVRDTNPDVAYAL